MTFQMNKDKIVEAPKDTILDGIITEIEETTWRKIVKEEKQDKFEKDSLDDAVLEIKYEYKFNESVLRGKDSIAYYPAPSAHSKLGKFLVKYTDLKIGTVVKVDINGEGFSSIRIK